MLAKCSHKSTLWLNQYFIARFSVSKECSVVVLFVCNAVSKCYSILGFDFCYCIIIIYANKLLLSMHFYFCNEKKKNEENLRIKILTNVKLVIAFFSIEQTG